jgi:hypothetical protein
MAALNLLFRRPPDSQESCESAPSEVLYDEDKNGLSSVVNNGPAFVAGLSKQQGTLSDSMYDAFDTGSSHFESFFQNVPCRYHVIPDNDDAADYYFKCPATHYDANSLEEFEEILSVLPKAKQPGPCWKWHWNRVPMVGMSYLHNILLDGAYTDEWDWGFAFWDEDRLMQWREARYGCT